MNDAKYIGLDVHQATISTTVLDCTGKLVKTDSSPSAQPVSKCSCRMVFADEFLYIHGFPSHLLSVHVADQGLIVGDIFFAHAASLRHTFCFARGKFSEVSSQLRYLVSVLYCRRADAEGAAVGVR